MIQIKQTFDEHKEEISLFYSFLDDIITKEGRLIINPPTNNVQNIKLETIAILKASFLMMLYNCVESTVVNCLNAIISSIHQEGCKYGELSDHLQRVAIAAYAYRANLCNNKDKRNEKEKERIDFLIGLTPVKLDVRSMVGSSSQGTFSGSLDAKEIRILFAKLGLNLAELTCDEMVRTRDVRNKLAHGEKSFQECGRDLSIQYLDVSKTNTLTYLDTLISKVEDYIDRKSFKMESCDENRGFIPKLINKVVFWWKSLL